MSNREIATRLLEEIELLQASSKQIGIPWKRTALALIEDALNEAEATYMGIMLPPPMPTFPPFQWPVSGMVKFDAQ